MIAAAVLLAAAAPAPFGCGAVPRPGLAERGADGVWRGRAVEVCRATARRFGGPGAGIAFHGYDGAAGLRGAGVDRIAFLSLGELAMVPGLRAGPVIAVERQVLAMRPASPIGAPGDLAGRPVCFLAGTRAEEALNAWAARDRVPIERLAFQEPAEMQDAFAVGKCAAEAVDAAELSPSDAARMLGAPLDETPILAATPAAEGDLWRKAITAVIAPRGAARDER